MTEKRKLKMIEEFQCPGCTIGGNTNCGNFALAEVPSDGFRCRSHSAGTFMSGVGKINLGLPKGFNRIGPMNNLDIFCWLKETPPKWDHLNVPVWAMEQDGFVFVRSYSPRVNYARVDVWEGGTLPDKAIDVSKFIDEID